VNGTCDLIRPWLIEGDGLRVARIDGEAGVSQLRRRISIGNALTIVASANNVEATCAGWINKLEFHTSFDSYRAYREVGRIHLNLSYRARGGGIITAGGLSTTGRRNCPKKQQGKDE
jgi:hypothetical protein